MFSICSCIFLLLLWNAYDKIIYIFIYIYIENCWFCHGNCVYGPSRKYYLLFYWHRWVVCLPGCCVSFNFPIQTKRRWIIYGNCFLNTNKTSEKDTISFQSHQKICYFISFRLFLIDRFSIEIWPLRSNYITDIECTKLLLFIIMNKTLFLRFIPK